MIDPAKVCLFQPSELRAFKKALFERIGEKIRARGGRIIVGNVSLLQALPKDIIPIVGCSSYLRDTISGWRHKKRPFIYWDRGYARRVFATWLPRGDNGGFYRYHCNAFQLREIRDVPSDRWDSLKIEVAPWRKAGRHIVIAHPTATYSKFHGLDNWTASTIEALSRITDRQLVVRDKETKRPLQDDLAGAHALVAHGSIAAVESVILGCPVFVHADSAAALVGQTDLNKIESPVYPDREAFVRSLAYSQFCESELIDGTLWKLLS